MMKHRFWCAYVGVFGLAALGCMPSDDPVESTEIQGAVRGNAFDVLSATADFVEGDYVVSLSDTAELGCDASSGLPMSYRVVRILGVDGAGSYSARDSVLFDAFEQGVSEGEQATDGTVEIESIGFRQVTGRIDARGPQSEVRGSFVAEICD